METIIYVFYETTKYSLYCPIYIVLKISTYFLFNIVTVNYSNFRNSLLRIWMKYGSKWRNKTKVFYAPTLYTKRCRISMVYVLKNLKTTSDYFAVT